MFNALFVSQIKSPTMEQTSCKSSHLRYNIKFYAIFCLITIAIMFIAPSLSKVGRCYLHLLSFIMLSLTANMIGLLLYIPLILSLYNIKAKKVNIRWLMSSMLLFGCLLFVPGSMTFLNAFVDVSLLMRSGDIHPNPGPGRTKPYVILYSNIRSITADDGARFECLKSEVNAVSADIVLLCEAGMKVEDVDKLSIDGYHPPVILNRGQGLAAYVHERLPLTVRDDLSSNETETLWFELPGCNAISKVLIGLVYRSPSQRAAQRKRYIKDLQECVRRVQSKCRNSDSIFIYGDFNCHNQQWWDGDKTDPGGKDLLARFSDLYLTQLVSEPTRVEGNARSCLDLFFTDSPGLVSKLDVKCPIGGTDHGTIVSTIDIKTTVDDPPITSTWLYHQCDPIALNSALENYDWGFLTARNVDTSTLCTRFTDTYLEIIREYIPLKINRPNKGDQPWFNNTIRAAIKNKEKLYKVFKRTGNAIDSQRYRAKSAEVTQLVKQAKTDYENNLYNNLDSEPPTSHNYWKLIKKFLGKRFHSEKISAIKNPLNGYYACNSKDKSEIFLDVLTKKYNVPANLPTPNFPNRTVARIADVSTTPDEIESILSNLDVGKASGPDEITNRMLKLTAPSISKPISTLINAIFRKSSFPSTWKMGHIVPIFKHFDKSARQDPNIPDPKEDKSNPNNYRPITLLSSLSKVCEKVIADRIYAHLMAHNLLYPLQSGFIKGHGTSDQLIAITDFIHRNLENGSLVKGIFLDISAAFDTVPHSLLLHKLKSYGVVGPLHTLIQSYLCDRRVRVKIENSLSNPSMANHINAGVPQGSILGPLLFLLYINDLPDNLRSKTYLYADDTSLYFPFKSNNANLVPLQVDLDSINRWSLLWKLEFKASKSVDLTFRSVRSRPQVLPDLILGANVIPKKSLHRHLGVVLDEKLNFSDHIRILAQKYQKMVNPLRRLSSKLPPRHLEKMYTTFILPKLDHGDLLYQSSSINNLGNLERIHYRAACAVSGVIRGSNTSKVLKNLNWETLATRRQYHLNCYSYKAEKNLKPSYITNILATYNAEDRDNRNIRNRRKYILPARISNRFSSSPALSLVKNVNKILPDIVKFDKFESFKSSQKKLLFKIQNSTPPTHLKIPITASKFLNRMRVGLLLKSHLFSHNFANVTSPACPCGHNRQDEKHFLLDCALLNNNRIHLLRLLETLGLDTLFQNLNKANKIKFLLYGDVSLCINDNDKVITATADFIFKSRFTFLFRPPPINP